MPPFLGDAMSLQRPSGHKMEVVGADSVGLWRRLQAKSRAETLGRIIFSGPEPWTSCSSVVFGLSAADC